MSPINHNWILTKFSFVSDNKYSDQHLRFHSPMTMFTKKRPRVMNIPSTPIHLHPPIQQCHQANRKIIRGSNTLPTHSTVNVSVDTGRTTRVCLSTPEARKERQKMLSKLRARRFRERRKFKLDFQI